MHPPLSATLWCVVLLLPLRLASAADPEQSLGGIVYASADWPRDGLGDHRAVVEVAAPADVVRATIPWRRHDADFRSKGVIVQDLATGAEVTNVLSCNLGRETGDVVFQPGTAPGRYAVYYLPYREVPASGEWSGQYLPALQKADPAWIARHGLADAAYVEPGIHFLGAPREDPAGGLGAPFEIVATSGGGYAGNDYAVEFEVRFADHAGAFVQPTLLAQDDGRGYVVTVYDQGGRSLVMMISRRDGTLPDGSPEFVEVVKANWEAGWPVNLDRPLRVSLAVKALPGETRITARAHGTGTDGQPFTTPLLTAVDASPARLATGAPPRFGRIYPGDGNGGAFVHALVIRDRDGRLVFDSALAPRGGLVENTATAPAATLDPLPAARLVKMEWRRRAGERPDMNTFFPMEIIASQAELEAVLAAHGEPALLFPEDRTRPVAMPDFLPRKWALDGPSDAFAGACQPSEYYCWQIGIWAAREDVTTVEAEAGDFRAADGRTVIRGADVSCFSLAGVDNHGRRFTREFRIGRGMVRPLWLGMMVPDDASGRLDGEVRVRINGGPPRAIRVAIDVAGPPIAEHGDDEPWRHSRLRWLDSTLGLDDAVVPQPYVPVTSRGATSEILGRTIEFGGQGLPARIVSAGHEVLAGAIRVDGAAGGRPLEFGPAETTVTLENPSRVARTSRSTAGPLTLTVSTQLWFDGAIDCELDLTATQDVPLDDLAVVVPLQPDVARYFVGFSHRGDRRPASWNWKWDRRYMDNAAWCGTVSAGLGIALRGDRDSFDLAGLRWGEHAAWINEGRGGASVREEGDAVLLRAFTGARLVTAAAPLRLRFRLFVTPFKPVRPDHWERWFMGNIGHHHHSTPVNPYINYPFLTVARLRQARDESAAAGQRGMTIYYTLRELSNAAPELFAFRSLGDEIVKRSGAFVYDTAGSRVAGEGGGHPWLREHLVAGYAPSWQQTLFDGEVDAAVAVEGDGRMTNYYIEGLAYLERKLGGVGVYLDGIGFDRITTLRLARVVSATGADIEIPYHNGDDFKNPWSERHVPIVCCYMEHLPYVTQVMFGEGFWFDGPEGYWMTNLAGLPFGIVNQFYPVPGPDYPFRSLLYAGAPNVGPAAAPVRELWRQWGINADTRTRGYWDEACPVRTGVAGVFATVHANKGRSLICLASWATEPVAVNLAIDWQALGIDPATARISQPEIPGLQPGQETFDLSAPLSIEPGKGLVIGVEAGR